MPNVLEYKQKAAELNREVQEKVKAVDAGTITVAEFSQYMENAEKQDAEIATAIKAYNSAAKFSGGASEGDKPEGGKPPEVEPSLKAKQAQANWATYKKLQECAARNAANTGDGRGSFSFDIAVKYENDIRTKAQGVADLMGVDADGTTAPLTGDRAGELFPEGAAGPVVEPQFIPGIRELRFYPNVVASLFPSMPVTSPVVTYVRENEGTYNAAATPEGATKPTSTDAVERFSETIGKIANLKRVTDELIQDAPLFWALIQNRGVQGVTRKEEVELLAGAGLPGVNGLLQRSAAGATGYPSGFTAPEVVAPVLNLDIGGTKGSGATKNTVASVTPGRQLTLAGDVTDGTVLAEGILQAITDIRLNEFYEPDASILNPIDWQTIRLAKDSNGQYLGGSFFGTNYGVAQNAGSVGIEQGLTVWGKRIVTTPVMPAALFLTGAFAEAGTVLRRGGLRVDVTNTNGFDFEQNLWTLRVEERVGLMVDAPELFVLTQVV